MLQSLHELVAGFLIVDDELERFAVFLDILNIFVIISCQIEEGVNADASHHGFGPNNLSSWATE